jgi:glycine hydroxymethyltransferase
LILVDVMSSFGVHGGIVEQALDDIGLTLNKNAIPNDTEPPFRPSGIRLGTPALTTRGLKEADMETLAEWMLLAIENRENKAKLEQIHAEVIKFARKFPLPSDK